MNKLSAWFAFGLKNSDSSFMVRVDLNKCIDYDDLRNQVMRKTKNYSLYKYALVKDGNIKNSNDLVDNFWLNNTHENPIEIIQLDKMRLEILKNEAHDFPTKDESFLWCSLDGFIPTKINKNNCLTLEDIQNELFFKFNKLNRPYGKCYINGKRVKLNTKIDLIKNNSYTNPVLFKRKLNSLISCII
ncbi:unnamed protein product [Brachionus calyciflorus]|uniref:Uncharacterized protein n=1 Tax=Brachionus calyciflorus TaxID=104777 RepID=A0A814L0T1_9BILA|nr:unnamed protein product [Brachionus calyciflorus]